MTDIVSDEEHAGFAENLEFRSLGIGTALGEVAERMDNKVRLEESQPKLYLFACHDTTIAAMLTALEVMKPGKWIWPNFGSTLTIELFSEAVDTQRDMVGRSHSNFAGARQFVRISFNGMPLIVPNCQVSGTGHEDPSLCELVSLAIIRYPVLKHPADLGRRQKTFRRIVDELVPRDRERACLKPTDFHASIP